ncbi:hypothetical protein F5J12DRAFT_781748 [Pisolithus orientalis]|uniref:uncharacterized protein n=1 Tax=Pisolithus orientalis TaxID=936130 RepID=UPI002224251D|nr:uncharacterized protein F5J12DRAFT_781748 [Pisolithus orientalis]KAI6010748.1 hypothetical protein F5J12DRAFT_781748 [Pisolithus orientalis]
MGSSRTKLKDSSFFLIISLPVYMDAHNKADHDAPSKQDSVVWTTFGEWVLSICAAFYLISLFACLAMHILWERPTQFSILDNQDSNKIGNAHVTGMQTALKITNHQNRMKAETRTRMAKDDEPEHLGDRSAWFVYTLWLMM